MSDDFLGKSLMFVYTIRWTFHYRASAHIPRQTQKSRVGQFRSERSRSGFPVAGLSRPIHLRRLLACFPQLASGLGHWQATLRCILRGTTFFSNTNKQTITIGFDEVGSVVELERQTDKRNSIPCISWWCRHVRQCMTETRWCWGMGMVRRWVALTALWQENT